MIIKKTPYMKTCESVVAIIAQKKRKELTVLYVLKNSKLVLSPFSNITVTRTLVMQIAKKLNVQTYLSTKRHSFSMHLLTHITNFLIQVSLSFKI